MAHTTIARTAPRLIDRVPDQEEVHSRRVEQARKQGVVAGEHDDALAALLHGEEIVGRDGPGLVSHRESGAARTRRRAPSARAARRAGSEARGAGSRARARAPLDRRSGRYPGPASAVPSERPRAARGRAPIRWRGGERAARRARGRFRAGPSGSSTPPVTPVRGGPSPRRGTLAAGGCAAGPPASRRAL